MEDIWGDPRNPVHRLSPLVLPEILGDEFAVEIAGREAEILDMAESLISQGAADPYDPLSQPLLRTHRDAAALARELMARHDGDSPADDAARYAAEQLKLWHLRALDVVLDRFLKQD